MNAIVFALRGCPAGWLGAYGNEWVATPNLDRLAAESVVFDRHISDCPSQDGANQSWFDGGRMLEELRSAGVRTAIVRANHPETDSPEQFYAGWGEVFDARPQDTDALPLDEFLRRLPGVLDRLSRSEPDAQARVEASPLLARRAPDARWLLWVEIDRLLPPWEVPQEVFEAYIADEGEELEKIEPLADPEEGPFDKSDLAAWEWLRNSFAAVVTALDAELGSAFDLLRHRGLDKSATWVVTSDFGYPLGEHGQVGVTRPDLHEELVHVPLIVRLPNAADAGRRVDGFTQPADLIALLQPAIERREREHVVSRLEVKGEKAAAIRTDHWAFLLPLDSERKPTLFIKPDDRWEVHDVLNLHETEAQELEAKLRSARI